VSSPYLESVLLGACPGLRESWDSHRRTFAGQPAPGDLELLDAVRRHVVSLVVAERLAEFARFARAMDRLLGEADPVLYELLREGLLRPLARDLRHAGVVDSYLAPHLCGRMALAWPTDGARAGE
jgi:hypothetical protein